MWGLAFFLKNCVAWGCVFLSGCRASGEFLINKNLGISTGFWFGLSPDDKTESVFKKIDGMRRADDEQNLGSPALHVIKLSKCTPEYILFLRYTPQGSKSGGYGHSRPDQSRPMYGDPGDHLILSRSDNNEDHRWCWKWDLTRLNLGNHLVTRKHNQVIQRWGHENDSGH